MSSTKRKMYRKSSETWCLNSTMDGLPSIARAKSHLIFWIVCFLICFGLCVYMVVKSIMDFYQYEVTTTDRLVAYDQIKFPMITFCNDNPFPSQRTNDLLNDYFRDKFGIVNISSYGDLEKASKTKNLSLEDELSWIKYQLSAGVWNESMQRSIGYSVKEMFYAIDFSSKTSNKSINLDWYFDKFYGNCFRFNSDQSWVSNRLGFGLYVEIFTGHADKYQSYLTNSMSKGKPFYISFYLKYINTIKDFCLKLRKLCSSF